MKIKGEIQIEKEASRLNGSVFGNQSSKRGATMVVKQILWGEGARILLLFKTVMEEYSRFRTYW